MLNNYSFIFEQFSNKFILDGALQASGSNEFLDVINPATLDKIASIANCNDDDINNAVINSEKAFLEWKKISSKERGRLVQECGKILAENSHFLAEVMSFETGKAIRTESMVEAKVIADTFNFYGGLALELKGETIPFDPNILSYTIREPLGVVAAIIPWNVPLMLLAMKVAPALVAGNTVVLKASPEASFCVLKAAELMNQILPKNVFNVVTGDAEVGKKLVAHPKIKKVSFTGSVESGRSVYKNAAEKIIPVTLELGGKSPFIICDDADIDEAVKCVFEGMRFTRQGQSCSAASRVFIHESLHDIFIEKIIAILDSKIIGDPMDEKTDIGTLISQRQYNKVQDFLNIANNDKSLTIHYGSSLPEDEKLKKGLFMRPAIISGLKNSHEICQKEIFGPVLALLKWSNFDEVIKEANATEFGLAGGIWTKDISKALKAAQELEVGFMQVNQYMVFKPSIAFGGFKSSGIGKEATLKAMIDHYTREKLIMIKI